MGVFRKRVNTKGKRWIKGQSSNSNPECSTFRKAARNNFCRDSSDKPSPNLLTVDSLRKHDNRMNSDDTDSRSGVDEDSNRSFIGSLNTFKTFASDWSCCSNMTFNKLLNRFDLSSALHKEMLAVLAAITEVIKANGGTENTTEYFAALITALEGIQHECQENSADADEDSAHSKEDSVGAMVSLLSMCIKGVRKETLQLKFSTICETLTRHLANFHDSDNNTILKSLIGCLSVVLRAQHLSVWKENSKTLDYYKSILEFVTHPKSKIRKAAQHAVCAVLKGSCFLQENPDTLHPAAEITAVYCLKTLETSFSEGGTTTVLHVLVLLKEIIAFFPKAKLKMCCNMILQLMTLKDTLITTCALQALYGLFTARPNVSTCPATLNAQLINALYDYQPPVTDSQSIIAWATVMQEAFVNLAKTDLSLCVSNVPKLCSVYSAAFLSEKPNVISSVTSCMQTVLSESIGPAATESNIEQYEQEIRKIFELLKNCMKYTYHAAWKSVLYLLATMYKNCGHTCSDFMIDYLRELADLRDSDEYAYEKEIDNIFGAAIESIGPEKIILQIPLQAVADDKAVLIIKRSWLLPLFRQHIKNSSLQCFLKNFRPLAVFFHGKKQATQSSDQSVAVAYDLLESQIWALLPTFCRSATDIKDTIPSIAKNLGDLLKSRSDLRSIILNSLRNLISHSENNPEDEAVMSRFAKNYLPILFNLYTTKCEKTNDEATRVSAFETIKVYLKITNSEMIENFFNEACNKLAKCESEDELKVDFEKEAILDLIRALIPFLSTNSLTTLFENRIKRIKKKLHFKEEKKYYRLLADICSSETESCKSFISSHKSAVRKLLIKAEPNTHLTSRGARIKTLAALLAYDSKEKILSTFLPEVVLCCKDGNQKCRSNAFELLNKMADVMAIEAGEDGVGKFLDMLLVGLVGTTSMISATILALASVVHSQEDKLNKVHFGEILKNICLLSQSKTREIVGPALGFLKVTISLRNMNLVQAHLQLMVKSLSGITKDCQRKYRQKIRDLYDKLVRKVGILTVISLVPTHDGETISRLKAIKKEQARKARKKLEAKKPSKDSRHDETDFTAKQKPKTVKEVLAECEEEESDSDEGENDRKEIKSSKFKKNVYLKEDEDTIIDFSAPSACNSISVSKPKTYDGISISGLKKKTKVEFPSAPDGRLIIQEDKVEVPSTSRDDFDSDDESIASDAEAEGRLSQMVSGININRKRKNTNNSDDEDEPEFKYQAGGSGIHRKVAKTNKSATVHAGKDFKAKKASGDMKRKDKPDPYAYIPLSRNALNRRKKKKSAGQFKHIVHSAKKGANRGAKNRSKANKRR